MHMNWDNFIKMDDDSDESYGDEDDEDFDEDWDDEEEE